MVTALCMLGCSSHVQLCATPWTAACQAPLSVEFSRQEYWSEFPGPPENLPDPGIKPVCLVSPALADGFFTTRTTWEAQSHWIHLTIIVSVLFVVVVGF